MDSLFLIKLALSFVVGGAWIAGTTVLAEVKGTKIGGMITGLPSTIVVALFFIAWTQPMDVLVESTTVTPIVQGVNYLFILAYVWLIRRMSFWPAYIGSLAVWFVLSLSLVGLDFNDFGLGLILYVTIWAFSIWMLEHPLKVRTVKAKKVHYTPLMLLSRGVYSGLIIAFAVLMTQFGGALLGGVFAMFPAVFTSTLLITHFLHGSGFSSAVLKTAIMGSITVVMYVVLVRYSYPMYGIYVGTLISVVISFASSAAIYYLIRTRVT